MVRFARFAPVILFIAAACAGPAPAASPTASGPGSKVGGSVTFAAISDPDTLDPHKTSNTISSAVFNWIYEGLVWQDLDNSYKGGLAESWTVSPDSRTITFKLRKGVKFTDGAAFDSKAVKLTFERLQKVGSKSPIFETFKNVTAMETPDDLTFVMKMKEPFAPIFHDLASSYAGIMSPVAVEKDADLGRHPVGTGPYKLAAWQTGQSLTLARNADHAWGPGNFSNRGAPYIGEVRIKVLPDPSSQAAALDAGEIDYLGLDATQLVKFEKDDRFKIYDSLTFGLTYLGFNSSKAPYSDPKLRRALSYAVNKDEIVSGVFENKLAKAACCPIAESIQGYDAKLADFEAKYDPAKAKSSLDALGYRAGANGLRAAPDGKPFQPVLYTTNSSTHGKIATLLQAQFKAVGVDLKVNQLESGALLAATPKGEHDLYLNGYSWNEPDMFTLFLSCERVKSSNRVLFCDQTLQDLIVKGRTELDQAKRLQIYFDAQKYTLEQAPWQPLYMPINKIAVHATVKDLRQGKSGALYWQDAYVAK